MNWEEEDRKKLLKFEEVLQSKQEKTPKNFGRRWTAGSRALSRSLEEKKE